MSTSNLYYYTSRSETNTNQNAYHKHSDMIADYANVLKEKVLLERSKNVLEVTCKEKEKRLNEAIQDLNSMKKKLASNDEIIETLQQQLKANLEHMRNEKQVFHVLNEQKDAVVKNLQADVKDLRKRYCNTNVELAKALKQVELYRNKCKEYKDKLRGFAILFTYFNDPKHESEETDKETNTPKLTRSRHSNPSLKSSSEVLLKTPKSLKNEQDRKILSELFFKHAFDDQDP